MNEFIAFVPNGESRRETAAYLVQACEDNGLDQHSIQTSRERDGFLVTEALADVLYDGPDEDPDEPETPATNTSGNRPVKNKNSEEESA